MGKFHINDEVKYIFKFRKIETKLNIQILLIFFSWNSENNREEWDS